jgi:7-carboxy-7-deazaguanine synthase
MAQYKVVETFVSINGEGVLAGKLAVFIRFWGCNLDCSYCDTAWAKEENAPFTYMSEQEIYKYIVKTGVKNVTLTGGEPLLVPDILQLLNLLAENSFLQVEIETNGSIDLKPYCNISNPPAFTMDYKLPGSLMQAKMLASNFELLTEKDTVKFVAGSLEDLECAKEIIEAYHLTTHCHVYISPVFGQISPEKIVEYLIKNAMNEITMQLQLHKVIWDPNKRGV